MGLWAFSFPKVFFDTENQIRPVIELLDELGGERGTAFSSLASVRQSHDEIVLSVDDTTGVWRDVVTYFGLNVDGVVSRIEVRYPATRFLPYDPKDDTKNFQYANGMVERMMYIAPEIRAVALPSLSLQDCCAPVVQ
jgi:hypothetical protein